MWTISNEGLKEVKILRVNLQSVHVILIMYDKRFQAEYVKITLV